LRLRKFDRGYAKLSAIIVKRKRKRSSVYRGYQKSPHGYAWLPVCLTFKHWHAWSVHVKIYVAEEEQKMKEQNESFACLRGVL
jgi:hypothetical protein